MSTAASQMVDTLHVYALPMYVCGDRSRHGKQWKCGAYCLWLSHTPTRLGTMEQVLKELEHSNAENNSIAAFKQGNEGEMKGRWRGDGVGEINVIHLFRCQTAL